MRKLYLKRMLLTTVLALLALPLLFAATITVTNSNSTGAGSLREAVNTAVDGDVIVFAASTNGNTIVVTTPQLAITVDLTIRGNGESNTIISGDNTRRIFNIQGNRTVRIESLTLTNGRNNTVGGAMQTSPGSTVTLMNVTVKDSEARGDAATEGGGGISNRGNLTLMNSTIINNAATGVAGNGGGILNNPGATLTILNSRIEGNTANRAGGGIEDASGSGTPFVIRNSVITSNSIDVAAPGNGGGIHVGGDGSLTVFSTAVTNNTAVEGGGIWIATGTLSIRASRVDNNVATGNDADQGGGGLYSNGGGTILVERGTRIRDNRATGTSGSGGGILSNTGATLRIDGATITGNEANRAGGGIEDASGAGSLFTIRNSQIDTNTVFSSPGNGGGIHIGSDGSLSVLGGTVSGNTAGAEGGGIWINTGTLRVREMEIDGNVALGDDADMGGGGLYSNGGGTISVEPGTRITNNMATGTSGSGGGILNNTGARLRIDGAVITGNTANRAGGGIEDASGASSMFTIQDSQIDTNTVFDAPGNGGGIHIGGDGSLSVLGGTVSGNIAGAEGGGIWIATGTLRVRGTEIDGNVAMGDDADMGGGGLYNNGGGTISVEPGTRITNNVASGASGSGGGILNNTGARLIVDQAVITGNEANRAGGGIEDASGSGSEVTITDTQLDQNIVYGSPGNGGGLHVGGNGNTTIIGGSVSGNFAGQQGGGLWNNAGRMSVQQVSIMNNIVVGNSSAAMPIYAGGGIYNNFSGGTVSITESTIANNAVPVSIPTAEDPFMAGAGGGVANAPTGFIRLTRSTVSGNTSSAGAGIANTGTATILRSTITNNTATLSAGGFAQAPAPPVYGTPSLTIRNTIISDNTTISEETYSFDGIEVPPADDFVSIMGTINSQGYNLIGEDEGTFMPANSTDMVGVSADLLPLADNGGQTMTHEPSCGSPAIDMGRIGDDQRDQIMQNIFGGRLDIGSFEKQTGCDMENIVANTEAAQYLTTDGDIAEAVSVFPNPARGNQINVVIPSSFEGDITLRIVDASGRVREVRAASAGNLQLQLEEFKSGTYMLQVMNGEDVHNVRFVIAR